MNATPLCRWLGTLVLMSGMASAQTGAEAMATSAAVDRQPQPTNRLGQATSPYLLQHAHNPVDWYEWGPEALEKARREDKPIFLSIGYAACHWCHVMAHESFENPAIAAVMNRLFVNIKVDREERPDIDEIYMRATVMLNRGQGGWPMSVWLTPELKPFFAGTYFPPESRWGRPGFGEFCERIGELWVRERAALLADADKLTKMVDESLRAGTGEGGGQFVIQQVDEACLALGRHFDRELGGISGGGPNKFPPSMALDLFLRFAARHGPEDARSRDLVQAVRVTLDRMAHGGIYDHLAGGICRYSTDVEWHVPHFEKMLYDQALVGRIYTDAFVYTGDPLYRRIAGEICDYVLNDLRAPGGGFYSSRDADSEGEEGRYYVWTRDEIVAELGPAEAELFCAVYDVTAQGNWADPHAPGVAKNVLRVTRPLAAVAGQHGVEAGELERRLAAGRTKLLAARARRVAPGLDDKVLVEWNGLMISTLARAGAALEEPRYTAAAARAADFVLAEQWVDGRLKRAWRAGRRSEAAFLSDYACLIEGLLDLYEATFERKWLDAALRLNATTLEMFWDPAGGFFFTPHDHEALIARSKDARDNATPSGNSVQLMNLLRLGVITGDPDLTIRAQRTLTAFHADISQSIGAAERFLAAVEFALLGPAEIALVGPRGDEALAALQRVVRTQYIPNKVVLHLDPARPEESPASPLLAGKDLLAGRAAAYVCRNYACQRPAGSAAELQRQLAGR